MGNIAGAPPVFGARGDRFSVEIRREEDFDNNQIVEWFSIRDTYLMKTVEGSGTKSMEEVNALCKLMNEGEKL